MLDVLRKMIRRGKGVGSVLALLALASAWVLPALHGWQIDGGCCGRGWECAPHHAGSEAFGCEGHRHANGHGHEHEEEGGTPGPDRPRHEPGECELCKLVLALKSGGAANATGAAPVAFGAGPEMIAWEGLRTPAAERPLTRTSRGPPAIAAA